MHHAIDDGSLSPVKMASFKGLPQLMLKDHGVDIFIRLLNGCREALQKPCEPRGDVTGIALLLFQLAIVRFSLFLNVL